MSYGLKFINNSDVVTLDSEYARLVVLESGTWDGFGQGVNVPFVRPVHTAEPPLIFVRPETADIFYFCTLGAGPDGWYGFSFQGVRGVRTTGKWFSAAFSAVPTADYGMRLRDGNSKLLFDSATPAAQFTRTITSWQYLGASHDSQGLTRLSWTAPFNLSSGDYMLLNNIAMDVAGLTSRQGNMYAVWEYALDRLVMQVVGVDISMTLYNPVVFAKPMS